jgi:hypothetical protein
MVEQLQDGAIAAGIGAHSNSDAPLARGRLRVTSSRPMDSLFRWIESSALSVWTRESTSLIAYPAILSAHAIGMALAAGVNAAIALRLLGAASEIPMAEMRRYAGVAWIGFAINAVSGMLLLIAYPTKALTNPMFYLKLSLIAVGLALFVAVNRRLEQWTSEARTWIGIALLVSWGSAIVAGRLLAYTYRRLMAG